MKLTFLSSENQEQKYWTVSREHKKHIKRLKL